MRLRPILVVVFAAACAPGAEDPADSSSPDAGESTASSRAVMHGSSSTSAVPPASSSSASEPASSTSIAPPSSSASLAPPQSSSMQQVEELDLAEIASHSLPDTLECGASASASVTVRNVGNTTWTKQGGYKLGAVGDEDPFADGRVELPDGVSVPPGSTWTFEVTLRAPSENGSHVTDWRMVHELVRWFGDEVSRTVDVACAVVQPEAPYRFDVVQAVAAAHPDLLQTNTYESCAQFVLLVLDAMGDPDWGLVGKTAGEGQHTPEGFEPRWVDGYLITGFSHDVIFHRPSNTQVDLLGNASANSDPNPAIWGHATPVWNVIPREYYRDNNPWLPRSIVP